MQEWMSEKCWQGLTKVDGAWSGCILANMGKRYEYSWLIEHGKIEPVWGVYEQNRRVINGGVEVGAFEIKKFFSGRQNV